MAYSLVQGDLEPDMLITLDAPGAIEALPTALSVAMLWKRPDGTLVTVPLIVVTATGTVGVVKRTWATGDSSQVGTHRGRVQVTCANGEIASDPNDGSWMIWDVYP